MAPGLGPGSPRRSASWAASSAERSFVPTTPSAGSCGELLEQLARIGVDHVEVRAREAHPVALGPREPLVAGLRTDDEDLTHPRQSRLPASCAEPPR